MLKATIVVTVMACAMPSTVTAQATATITVGDRIRVTTADRPAQIGRVSVVDATTIGLQPDGNAAPVSIARAGVTRIEISRGIVDKKRSVLRGAMWGAVISGVAGAISLGLQHDTVGENGSSVGEAVALGAYSGGLLGGLIGAAVGARRGGEKWQQIWP